jgi:hypothetical protein
MTPLALQVAEYLFEVRIVGESFAEIPVVCKAANQVVG